MVPKYDTELLNTYRVIGNSILGKTHPDEVYAISFRGKAGDLIRIHLMPSCDPVRVLNLCNILRSAGSLGDIEICEVANPEDVELLEWKVLLNKDVAI